MSVRSFLRAPCQILPRHQTSIDWYFTVDIRSWYQSPKLRQPKGKDRLPLPPFFRGKLAVKLRGCINSKKVEMQRFLCPIPTWRMIPGGPTWDPLPNGRPHSMAEINGGVIKKTSETSPGSPSSKYSPENYRTSPQKNSLWKIVGWTTETLRPGMIILQISDVIPKSRTGPRLFQTSDPPSPYSMQRCWHSAPLGDRKHFAWWWTVLSHDGSMGQTLYLATFTLQINHSCRWIYHPWILWVSEPNSLFLVLFSSTYLSMSERFFLFESTFKLDQSPVISGFFQMRLTLCTCQEAGNPKRKQSSSNHPLSGAIC